MFRTIIVLAFLSCILSPAYGGAEGGPKEGESGTLRITFKGDELAVIAAAGRSYRAVSIKVYDADDKLIAEGANKQDSDPSLALVTFVPRKTAEYRIEVSCSGNLKWKTN